MKLGFVFKTTAYTLLLLALIQVSSSTPIPIDIKETGKRFLHYQKNLAKGLGIGAYRIVQAPFKMIAHPVQTAKGVAHFIKNPKESFAQIGKKDAEMCADPKNKGKCAGINIATFGTMFIPGAGIAGAAVSTASNAQMVTDLGKAGNDAKAAEKIEEAEEMQIKEAEAQADMVEEEQVKSITSSWD